MFRIKQLRNEQHWTQEYLGSLLNVNKSAISKYENGNSVLTAQTIIILCKIFQVSADYLLGISSFRTTSNYGGSALTNHSPIFENDSYTADSSISADDKKILQYYHRLNDENKDDIKGQMVHLFKEQNAALDKKE